MASTERPDFSGIDAMTRGDVRQARQLRGSLAVIARRTEDPELRALVVRVLGGQESVRRVFAHPSFWQLATTNFENLEKGLDRLSDEEREEVMDRVGKEATDDEVVAAMQESVPPPPPPPDDEPKPPVDRGPARWG